MRPGWGARLGKHARPSLPHFGAKDLLPQLPSHLLVPRICPPSLIRSRSRGCRGGSGPGGGPASWWCRFLCFFLCFLCFFLWPPWPPASASCPVRRDTGSSEESPRALLRRRATPQSPQPFPGPAPSHRGRRPPSRRAARPCASACGGPNSGGIHFRPEPASARPRFPPFSGAGDAVAAMFEVGTLCSVPKGNRSRGCFRAARGRCVSSGVNSGVCETTG